ncbi:hypothetical protein DFQ28_002865 [Apophysomyces sp. BC1034]|nr:hypothetical protein DFQ30_003217 [Apophysomyces sp. BC1015]KAG0179379.1 hypothetical protein DFQ29_002165 [Apophysomyces sp. BC1021]KAG0189820.1 hypothetical protein DFQ28_002865 [Apophysomyces sp. BC1034]
MFLPIGIFIGILIVVANLTAAAIINNDGIIRLPLRRNENGQLASMRKDRRDNVEATAPLYNANGREYLATVDIGTPPKSFDLAVDTGSGELWIPSIECAANVCPYDRYDHTKSSTFRSASMPFSIEYGRGSANGTYAYETVGLGGATVDNQMIGMATHTEDILGVVRQGRQNNGIMGLGFPGLNSARGVKNDVPFVFHLVANNVIREPVFSLFLNSQFKFGRSGQIVLGGIDQSHYSGKLRYVPVVPYTISAGDSVSPNLGKSAQPAGGIYLYWTVPGQAVTTSAGYRKSVGLQAFVLDTGTTLTYLPPDVADGIIRSVSTTARLSPTQGVYRVDCNLAKSTESVEFQLSTSVSQQTKPAAVVSIRVPVSELVIPLNGPTPDKSTACMFGIAPAPTDLSLSTGQTWMLGEGVLRSVYTVYDMKQNRVGVAPAATRSARTSQNATATTTETAPHSSTSLADAKLTPKTPSSSTYSRPSRWLELIALLSLMASVAWQ